MNKGMNYGLFMIITMTLLHLNHVLYMSFAFIIALIWSIYMLYFYVINKREWNWFFSSTLTWALIGTYYVSSYNVDHSSISSSVLVGTLLSFSFLINSIASLITPTPFTYMFEEQGSIKLHIMGTLFWVIFIFSNLIFSIYSQNQPYLRFPLLIMINIFMGIFFIKKWLRGKVVS